MTAERAHRLMMADEFLAWADGRPGSYELVDGVAVAMAPASRNHARIAQNIGTLADSALAQRRPCRAVQQGGVRLPAVSARSATGVGVEVRADRSGPPGA